MNPILFESEWRKEGSCDWQVLPHPKQPGCFMARAVVRASAGQRDFSAEVWRRLGSCGHISCFQFFVETEGAGALPVPLEPTEALDLLPVELAAACRESGFPQRLEYWSKSPGQPPESPVYPVWTRDLRRSTQVVDGKYAEIVPLSFEFIPTLNCIYRCPQCAYRKPKEELGIWTRNCFSPDFHMDEATVRSLLLKLRDAGVLEILFTGGGEPLLNAATPVGMQYAHDLGMKVGLYTNGALIDERTAKTIIEAQPAYVRLSLNAGQWRLYYQHHNPLAEPSGVDYFRSSYNALTLLARERARLRSRTVIAVSYLVDPENALDVVNGARRVAETARVYPHSIGYMRFTPSVNYFGQQQHPREVFERALRLIENEAVPLLNDAHIEPRVYFHRFSGLYETRSYSRCLAAGWYGGVGPGGILYWCCEKLFQRPFAFGSLLEGSFDELWAGAERKRVAELVAEAVKGQTPSPCPVVCKPHEHNKVFSKIEKLREQGEIGMVRGWLGQIHRIVATGREDAKPRLDGFES